MSAGSPGHGKKAVFIPIEREKTFCMGCLRRAQTLWDATPVSEAFRVGCMITMLNSKKCGECTRLKKNCESVCLRCRYDSFPRVNHTDLDLLRFLLALKPTDTNSFPSWSGPSFSG